MNNVEKVTKLLEEVINAFEEKTPQPFKETIGPLKEVEGRLIEIKLPKMMWAILDRGLQTAKTTTNAPHSIDDIFTAQIIVKMFLPTDLEYGELLFGGMREVCMDRAMGGIFKDMAKHIKKAKEHKDKGYE